MDIHLFRLYTIPSLQGNLFGAEQSREEVLRTTFDRLLKKAAIDKRWHVGNPFQVNDNVMLFKIGKVRVRRSAQFENGKFIDFEGPDAMYTHCFLDFHEGLLAVEKKSQLGRDATDLAANRFVQMLRRVFKGQSGAPEFDIESIPDPEKFISLIGKADYIRKFFISFLRPNPIKVDPLITVPMNQLIRETQAVKTHVEIMGPDLKKKALTALAKDAAGRGADASAVVYVKGKKRFIKLRQSTATINISEIDTSDRLIIEEVWKRIEKFFNNLRGQEAKARRLKKK